MKDLITEIDRIVINSNARLLAVVRKSISDVIEDAQTPVAKGGKMRVDTGFLRSSGLASLNAPPRGLGRGDRKGTYTWNGEAINSVLARIKIGDVVYFGWTANYAKYREVFDGFLESAVQKWQNHVNSAVQYFRNKDVSK